MGDAETLSPCRRAHPQPDSHARAYAHYTWVCLPSGRRSLHSGSFRDLRGCVRSQVPGYKDRSRLCPLALLGLKDNLHPTFEPPRRSGGGGPGPLPLRAHPHPPMSPSERGSSPRQQANPCAFSCGRTWTPRVGETLQRSSQPPEAAPGRGARVRGGPGHTWRLGARALSGFEEGPSSDRMPGARVAFTGSGIVWAGERSTFLSALLLPLLAGRQAERKC